MTALRPVLFIDHDGTLVEEPPDQQVDSLEKVRFMPGVFAALQALAAHGYRLVIVSNQDGLGTPSHPSDRFEQAHQFILEALRSQGVTFEQVFLCPHFAADGCDCRKPRTGLLREFLRDGAVDLAASAVIGDRDSDLELARNLGTRGLLVRRDGSAQHTWPAVVQELTARRATVERVTKETRIGVSVDLDATTPVSIHTGIGFFDHMLEQLAKHGGFAMILNCAGDLNVDEHHTVEDCALAIGEALRKALGPKLGINRYGFLLPMDEARTQVAIDLSGRAYAVFEGRFGREEVGGLATELVPHFFRSLADSLGAAIHISVTGENSHHMIEACFKGTGRALRQAFRREGRELPSTKGRAVSIDVAIIDSGGANLASLQFALERLGAQTVVTRDLQEISAAPRVLLPGVGSALAAMQRLNASGIASHLPQLKQPVLGICLGMQLLFLKSEEGPTQCLGVLPQTVRRLEPKQGRPVPHMGWNRLHIIKDDPLLEGVAENEYLYFVHSYAAPVSQTTLASCNYGVDIAAVVRKGNFWGTQFHPERSTKAGARILANFLRLT